MRSIPAARRVSHWRCVRGSARVEADYQFCHNALQRTVCGALFHQLNATAIDVSRDKGRAQSRRIAYQLHVDPSMAFQNQQAFLP